MPPPLKKKPIMKLQPKPVAAAVKKPAPVAQAKPAPGIRQQLPNKPAPQTPEKPIIGPQPATGPYGAPPSAGIRPQTPSKPGALTKTNIRQPLTKTNVRQPLGPRNLIRQGKKDKPQTNPNTGRPVFGGPDDGRGAPPPGDKKPSLQDRLDAYAAKLQAQRDAPMAVDSIYNSETAAANKAYGDAMIGAALQEAELAREMGFDPQYQQGGANYNPYSRASQLSAAWERDRRGSINSSAAAGQLYAGSMQNQLGYDDADYLSNYNAARSEESQRLSEIASQRTGAAEARESARIDAMKSFGERALESRPDDAPPPPKFVKKAKNKYKDQLSSLKDKRDDAKNKKQRKKVTQKIKKTKKKLGSIPSQYEEV